MLETLWGIRGEELHHREQDALEEGADNKQICPGCNNVCQAGGTVHTHNHVTISVGGCFFEDEKAEEESMSRLLHSLSPSRNLTGRMWGFYSCSSVLFFYMPSFQQRFPSAHVAVLLGM